MWANVRDVTDRQTLRLSHYIQALREHKIDDLLGLYDQDLTMFIETLSRRKYVYFS